MSEQIPTAPQTDTTVDAVDDLGWDPTGEDPITFPELDDGTRLEIPAGEYLWDGDSEWGKYRAWDIDIQGAGRDKVTIKSAPGTRSTRIVNANEGRRLRMGGITFDWGPRGDTAGPCFRWNVQSDIWFHDLRIEGVAPAGDGDDGHDDAPLQPPDGYERAWNNKIFNILVRDPDGVALVENCDVDFSQGAFMDGHKGGEGLCILHRGHEGLAIWRDCYWNNINGDAPVYADGKGDVRLEDCEIINCAMAGIRVGGEAVVDNCRVVIDHDNSNYVGRRIASNAVLWAGQTGEKHGGVCRNTTVEVRSIHSGGQAFRFAGTACDTTVEDSHVIWDVDGKRVVKAIKPGEGYGNYHADKPWHLTFNNFVCTGSGRTDVMFELDGRDGSSMTGCCDVDHGRNHSGMSDVSYQMGDGPCNTDGVGCDLSATEAPDGGDNPAPAPEPEPEPTQPTEPPMKALTFSNTGDTRIAYDFRADVAEPKPDNTETGTHTHRDNGGGHGELAPGESMTWQVLERPANLSVLGNADALDVTIAGSAFDLSTADPMRTPSWNVAGWWWDPDIPSEEPAPEPEPTPPEEDPDSGGDSGGSGGEEPAPEPEPDPTPALTLPASHEFSVGPFGTLVVSIDESKNWSVDLLR